MSTTSAPSGADGDHDRVFLGHPRGLGYIAFTEAWERFSNYGMQTLLVLYMTKQLLLPGHVENIGGFPGFRAALERSYGGPLSVVALASAIFGLYTGLVYLTPIMGGFIADRWLGRTRGRHPPDPAPASAGDRRGGQPADFQLLPALGAGPCEPGFSGQDVPTS